MLMNESSATTTELGPDEESRPLEESAGDSSYPQPSEVARDMPKAIKEDPPLGSMTPEVTTPSEVASEPQGSQAEPSEAGP